MLNTVLDYLIQSYKSYPDKPALIYSEREMTYGQLYLSAVNTAGWINENIGCVRQPVIVMMKNSDKAVAAFLGVALSGNIYVPIDSDMPEDRLRVIIDILNPRCVINCEDDIISDMFECPVISYDEIQNHDFVQENVLKLKESIIDTDPLYILFTSGSTGVPKGVVVSHRAVIDFTEEASEKMEFSKNEIFLNQAPFYFDASVPDIFCTIRNGATLHIVDKSLFAFPIKIVDYISQNNINAIYWVPSALVTVANMKVLGKRDISCLKKIMFCGEVMPAKQLNMWMKAVPEAKYVNYYGPCEATYACSYYIIDRHFEDDEPLPIGKAAKNTALMIINDNKEVLSSRGGLIGEIYIRGSGLALGYYNNPEKTKENFVQNPLNSLYPETVYKTGDLAHYDEEGNIIYDGRCDYQIKHMGYRIELGEIETCVGAIEKVNQTACIYIKSKEMIICYYSGMVSENEIVDVLKRKLPFYMIPKKIIKMDSLPMNMNGKIDRKKLESNWS